MQDFINFLVDNWQFISNVAISIIGFILLLIFRKTKLVDNSLLYQLTGWIQQAERKYIDGKDKKDFVIQQARTYLGEDFYKSDVSALIEYLLSLPSKKGGK